MSSKLVLQTWTNSKEATKQDIIDAGAKIIKVMADDGGHTVRYRHQSLTRRPQKGDLVEYRDTDSGRLRRAIIQGTDQDRYCIKDHVDIRNSIMHLYAVTKIIQKQLIPKKYFKYLEKN